MRPVAKVQIPRQAICFSLLVVMTVTLIPSQASEIGVHRHNVKGEYKCPSENLSFLLEKCYKICMQIMWGQWCHLQIKSRAFCTVLQQGSCQQQVINVIETDDLKLDSPWIISSFFILDQTTLNLPLSKNYVKYTFTCFLPVSHCCYEDESDSILEAFKNDKILIPLVPFWLSRAVDILSFHKLKVMAGMQFSLKQQSIQKMKAKFPAW